MEVFLQKEQNIPDAHTIGAAIASPRIAGEKLQTLGFLWISDMLQTSEMSSYDLVLCIYPPAQNQCAQKKFLVEFMSAQIHAGPVLAVARVQETIFEKSYISQYIYIYMAKASFSAYLLGTFLLKTGEKVHFLTKEALPILVVLFVPSLFLFCLQMAKTCSFCLSTGLEGRQKTPTPPYAYIYIYIHIRTFACL